MNYWNSGVVLIYPIRRSSGSQKNSTSSICCANDIPAARKLCGHISAKAACYRCHKRANVVGRRSNFGGFDDISEWFQDQDSEEHHTNAKVWRYCTTQDKRDAHVSANLVQWSEMLRLPYLIQ